MKKIFLKSFCARCLTLLVPALLSTNLAWGEETEIYKNEGSAGTSDGITAAGNVNTTASNGNPGNSFANTSASTTNFTFSGFDVSSYTDLKLSIDVKFSYPSTTNTFPKVTVTFYKNQEVVKTDGTTIAVSNKVTGYNTYTITNIPDFDKIELVCTPGEGLSGKGNPTTTYGTYMDNITIKGTPKVISGSHFINTVVSPENAGSITLGSATVAEGATTTATANANEHFTFIGWSISGEGSTLSSTTDNPTTITMGTEDATITANFEEDTKYDVTFNANGGSGEMDAVSVYAGDYTLPECDFTKTGYKFVGWKANNAGELIAVGSSYTITNTAVEFYAQWEETTDINVTYNFRDANSYPAGFPTSGTNVAVAEKFNFGGNYLIINAPTSYYQINSSSDEKRALFFGQSATDKSKGAYLEFPAKAGYKLAKVTATTGSGVAGSVVFNIYDTSWNAKSANCTTSSTTSKEFIFTLSSPDENAAYRLAASTSGKNLQFFSIELTYEKVSSVTRTITAAKYATLGLPYAVTIPENVSAYTATVEDTKVTMTKIQTGKIPANCGVILYAEAGDYTFTETADVSPISGNQLVAVVSGPYTCGDDYGKDYYLGKDTDGSAIFKKLNLGGTIAAGKAYLKLDKALSEGAKLEVTFGEPTGITSYENDNENENLKSMTVYNLNGVRVNEAYKGIVIMNGKKYINK